MKLTVDLSIKGLFVRVEKIEGHQSQHDRESSQNGLKRWTKEEVEAQVESFLPFWDRVESIQ